MNSFGQRKRLPLLLFLLVAWATQQQTATMVSAFLTTTTATPAQHVGARRHGMLLHQTPVQAQEAAYWARSDNDTGVTTRPEIVYILLYNAGTAEQAVHTSSLDDNNGQQEILWAFEDIGDCMEFASLLVQHEPAPEFNMALGAEPTPTPTPLSQMETASQDMGLLLRLVPQQQQA